MSLRPSNTLPATWSYRHPGTNGQGCPAPGGVENLHPINHSKQPPAIPFVGKSRDSQGEALEMRK